MWENKPVFLSVPDQEAIQATQEYVLRMIIFCGEGRMLELY